MGCRKKKETKKRACGSKETEKKEECKQSMRTHAKVVPTILILIIISFYLPCIRGSNSYIDVTVSEAKKLIDSNPLLVILDVRTQSEYDSGHIRNAKLIPHTELEARIDELDKNRDTLVYCRSGHRSAIASEILANHSFQKVYNMLGGILAWMDAGYPVYEGYSSIQQAINKASEGDSIFVSSGTYYEHLVVNKTVSLVGEKPETTVIDGNRTQTVVAITAHNVNVTKFTVQNGDKGVYLNSSSGYCIIAGCNVINTSYGIFLESDNNLLTRNNIVNSNESGIEIFAACGCSPLHGNTVTKNRLLNNSCGIRLTHSVDGFFWHNNFFNNTQQVFTYGSNNTWDNGYPSGGNYWSDYTGVDLFSGPYQNENGNDGIGDTPYVIDWNNQDNYPLMTPYILPEELRVLYYGLLEKYNDLLADYQGLNSTYSELESKQEATINELNNIRNLMYIFIGTTIIFMATTVYFARRKPKS